MSDPGTPLPDDLPDDPDAALAAEFVLRLLDPAEEAACRARADRDPAFAAEVARWQNDFSDLDGAFAPATPPARLHARVETEISAGPPAALPGSGPARRSGAALPRQRFWPRSPSAFSPARRAPDPKRRRWLRPSHRRSARCSSSRSTSPRRGCCASLASLERRRLAGRWSSGSSPRAKPYRPRSGSCPKRSRFAVPVPAALCDAGGSGDGDPRQRRSRRRLAERPARGAGAGERRDRGTLTRAPAAPQSPLHQARPQRIPALAHAGP